MLIVFWIVLGLGVLWWLWRRVVSPAKAEDLPPPWGAWRSAPGVHARLYGERGMGGPAFGDVLCSDGVYLSHVWERDFATSDDGRWLLQGGEDGAQACLVDRQQRRVWPLDSEELVAVHAIAPQWARWTATQTEPTDADSSDAAGGMSEHAFQTWLAAHVASPGQALVAVQDLWVLPWEVPSPGSMVAPVLEYPAHAAVQPTLVRCQLPSLRTESSPLDAWVHAGWQLLLNGQPQPWVLEPEQALVWRADGQALACYGYPLERGGLRRSLQLAAWSVAQGWQTWPDVIPPDRKPWVLTMAFPDAEQPPSSQPAALEWEGDVLLQHVAVDTPELERLHDGSSLTCVVSQIEGCAQHAADGRPILAPVPAVGLWWRKDLAHPTHWVAHSAPVAGHRLRWTLHEQAPDQHGATAAYALQWGTTHIPGLWELEHAVVQGRWALLRPWGKPVIQGGQGLVSVWDGQGLQVVDMPWPVQRIRPAAQMAGSTQPRMSAVVLLGVVQDAREHASMPLWRWPVQAATVACLDAEGWSPVYEMRALAPDAHGQWQLQPRWRQVAQLQHPCADGDYVWELPGGDALWWWGGLNQQIDNYWDRDAPRMQGVCVTRSGAVLCGVGPSACPHPDGDGWAVLEYVERCYGEPDAWLLHWLRPAQQEVRSVPLRAYLPLLQGWDAQQGVQWVDGALPDTDADPQAAADADAQAAAAADADAQADADAPHADQLPTPQVMATVYWEGALRQALQPSPAGLWLRQQDAAYADAMALRDDWPWARGPSRPA